ncbi:MAG: UDP-N-acetylglucosamine 2-epimerase (non-hydrolyzing) [Candidatus Rokubacteria bacterium]|nr:UDP-N-acetylglucosamine 2-epimerase (non-hydrolyzing) [Candidatus Rokubacteria bacterium]
MKVVNVVGARPNFVKIAPLIGAMRRSSELASVLVHTGQHYDPTMSERFFADLEIPPPDVNLSVGSGSHAIQTAEIMCRLEPVLEAHRPDVVLVVGDVNSTLAAALTAAKLGIPIAHVEAGLRSFDRSMPEEINRVLTDALADLLFVTEGSGCQNLLREGVAREKIHFVGNVMIDALEASRTRWQASSVFERLGIESEQPYAVLTLHRPANVDDPGDLTELLDALQALARHVPIVFPVHPRIAPRLSRYGTEPVRGKGITCLPPLGYLDFIALVSRARLVLTDSGGVQEETTILGVPCLTLRETTERPVTVTNGTNRVVGTDPGRILREALRTLADPPPPSEPPPFWDGRAAERIVGVLLGQARITRRTESAA